MKKYKFDSVTMSTIENLKVPLAVFQRVDKRITTIALSDGFCDMLGFSDRDEAYRAMDYDMFSATHPDDTIRIANETMRFIKENGKYDLVYRTLKRDGSGYRIIHAVGEHVDTDSGERLAYVWFTDEGAYTSEENSIDENLAPVFRQALYEESLINTTYFDYLTGLPNMTYFFELAESWRKSHIENGGKAAMLFLDLCGMKYYNRKFGFSQGDNLLKAFAEILKKHFPQDACSRFSSDHFCVFTDAKNIETTLSSIFDEIAVSNDPKILPVRIGITISSDTDSDISGEFDKAKYACDSIRNTYLSKYCYYQDTMLTKTQNISYILDNLDRAIEERWIQIYYQPIVRVANGRVCDEEALSRWVDPVRGMINPDDFIPILEESNLIYKLDLYVTERVLEKMKKQANEGLYVVSSSINLSRSDFDTCDIVEEIRKRVDAAGIERNKINIELTESTLGNDFEYIKSQIDRFRELGFNVWMDDFGSGYSSLDVLQSIQFDLIKFDMRFMKEFYNGDKSKIILTELTRMAIALGIDTVCEGVETKDQADFLFEVGCTKLQGYYFCRPIPYEKILERYKTGTQIGFENPEESDYYAAIGKINLYDLAILSNDDEKVFEHYFNTIPMAIIESNDEKITLIRCNNSYRAFITKNFGNLSLEESFGSLKNKDKSGYAFLNSLRDFGKADKKTFLDEELPDGSIAHAIMKTVALNPTTGTRAIAVAILAVLDNETSSITFTQVAKALSADYISLYYVDINTERFIEYKSNPLIKQLSIEQRNSDFFRTTRTSAKKLVFADDREAFTKSFTKSNVLRSIERNGAYVRDYRLILDDKPTYVTLKAVRTKTDKNHLIVGIINTDVQMRQKEAFERMREEKITFSRIAALTDNFICIYTVDPKTDSFYEYSTTDDYDELNIAKQGENFFDIALRESINVIYQEDLEMFRSSFSKKKILDTIQKNGIFALNYRLVIKNKPINVCMKGALVEEKDGPQLIIGVTDVDKQNRTNRGDA
ncbi:MAG: GGDEF and EAL domain-containing protein [Ruminococcus sp.]|nr:GGDEF and EAL domain-containing protein [Ruminococcus sp.]